MFTMKRGDQNKRSEISNRGSKMLERECRILKALFKTLRDKCRLKKVDIKRKEMILSRPG